MIFKSNNLLKIVIFILYLVTIIMGDCEITCPSNPLIKPNLIKQIGSRNKSLSTNETFTLHNNQEIIATCDIKFKKPEKYNDRSEVSIRCDSDYLYINGNYWNRNSRDLVLECASLTWGLYELSQPFVWCPSHMASYVLARPYRNLAGICYDTSNMTISSIYYTLAATHYTNLSPSTLATYDWSPMDEIKNVKDIFELKSVKSDNYDKQQFQNWITFTNYQYDSIIQNSIVYQNVYNELGSLLDFQWLPNLRLYNWHFYEEALAKHLQKERFRPYDILAGVSGVLMAPTKEACEKSYTMKNVIDKSNNKIPMYVWNYLYPTFSDGADTGIVIIGFNSPFNKLKAETDVVFCQDICHTIEWLENVRSTFRYNIMGIVFCCSVEEVRSSKRLDDFPQYMTKPIQETTLTPSFDQTTTTY